MSNLIWSYSFLNTYDRCALQAKARYIDKALPYVESPEMSHGNKVHKLMEDRLKGAIRALPTEFESYEKYIEGVKKLTATPYAEYQLGVTRDWKPTEFFARNVWGRCKLDCTIIGDDDAIILDWKTGKVREDPLELEIQACVLKCAHPHIKSIRGMYVWLKEDRYGEVYELDNTDETKKYVERVMKEVSKELWYPNKNALCPWCELKTCRFYKETRK